MYYTNHSHNFVTEGCHSLEMISLQWVLQSICHLVLCLKLQGIILFYDWSYMRWSFIWYSVCDLNPRTVSHPLINYRYPWWHMYGRYLGPAWASFDKYLSGLLVRYQGDRAVRQKPDGKIKRIIKANVSSRQLIFFLNNWQSHLDTKMYSKSDLWSESAMLGVACTCH